MKRPASPRKRHNTTFQITKENVTFTPISKEKSDYTTTCNLAMLLNELSFYYMFMIKGTILKVTTKRKNGLNKWLLFWTQLLDLSF